MKLKTTIAIASIALMTSTGAMATPKLFPTTVDAGDGQTKKAYNVVCSKKKTVQIVKGDKARRWCFDDYCGPKVKAAKKACKAK